MLAQSPANRRIPDLAVEVGMRHGWIRRIAWGSAVALALGALFAVARAQSDGNQAALRAAMEMESVRGDLAAAIAAYQKVVDDPLTSPAVAALALLRQAEAQEKLGQREPARAIYQRLVDRFGDRPEAATARTRLRGAGNATAGATGPNERIVGSFPWWEETYSRVSPSGRFIAFVNWQADGDLFVRDLTDGSTRRLTNAAPAKRGDDIDGASISHDDRFVAYAWHLSSDEFELRIADLAADSPKTRVLMTSPHSLLPADWTPDGRQLLVKRARPDGTKQLLAVAVSSGEVRALKTVDWRGVRGLFVSPDGQYVAFSQPASDTTQQVDIRVLALDASREISAVAHPAFDELLGWSPDGKHLLFTSDRGGRSGLWAVRFEATGVPGTPRLLRSDVGAITPEGISRSGAILYREPQFPGTAHLYLTSYDFLRERGAPPVTLATGQGESGGTGITWGHAWSPDGTLLAYVPSGGPMKSLVIRTIATGQQRTIELALTRLWSTLAWEPNGHSLLAFGIDLKGRWGMHRIDIATGQPTPVVLVPPDLRDAYFQYRTPEWAPDGRSIYFRRPIRTGPQSFDEAWMKYDLADGKETELFRASGADSYLYGAFILVSPDGRYLATKATGSEGKRDPILIIPTDGSPVRELASTTGSSSLGVLMWAPDSHSLFVKKRTDNEVETWRYSLDGRAHRVADRTFDRIDGVGSGIVGYARVAPDGKQVVFGEVEPHAGDNLTKIWALERVLD
jgi:Tol biopolymer transport system component